MKKFEKVLPYLLLIGYLILSQFKTLDIPQSIVLISLAALAGYRAYLNSKEQPNYAQQFADILNQQEKKISDLQGILGQHALSQKKIKDAQNIRW